MFKDGIEVKTIISIVVSAVSILTPFFYLIGLNYYQGRLTGFGVPSGLFPISFEDCMVNAYVITTILLTKYLPIFSGTLIGIFAIIFIVYLIFPEKIKKWIKKDNGKEKNNESSKASNIIILILLLILLPIISYESGEKYSSEIITNFSDEDCKYESDNKWEYCVEVRNALDDSVVISGVLVAINDTRASLFDGEKTTTVFLQENHILIKHY